MEDLICSRCGQNGQETEMVNGNSPVNGIKDLADNGKPQTGQPDQHRFSGEGEFGIHRSLDSRSNIYWGPVNRTILAFNRALSSKFGDMPWGCAHPIGVWRASYTQDWWSHSCWYSSDRHWIISDS